jgi:gliding motility-associated-like protein
VLITDIDNGCNITDTFNIAQPDSIWVSDTLFVMPECLTDSSGSITINVVGGKPRYQYYWYPDNVPPFPDFNDQNSIVDIPPGIYNVLISDSNGCTILETYQLDATSILEADAGDNQSYCEGLGPAVLIGTGNGISHFWIDTLGNVLAVGDTLTIDPPPDIHTYIFVVSDGICAASDTAMVEVFESPKADAGPDHEIKTDESVVIGGNPTAPENSIISWSPSLGLSDTIVANPVASPFETTQYIVLVTETEHGCMSSDTMMVTVVPDFIPNDGFTPNGDGINDIWNIGNIEQFPNIEVTIFNRWGELLFSSTGYNVPWDGLYDGNPVPVGTYYYVIDLHDERYPDAFTGPLTIMR